MKKIENYTAAKYKGWKYKKIKDGIYRTKADGEKIYVTSLSFLQEPELDEGDNASDISQYPLEDILDKFYCYISDFYEDLNISSSETCFLEFASSDLEDIQALRSIIGKHVYNKEVGEDVELIIV